MTLWLRFCISHAELRINSAFLNRNRRRLGNRPRRDVSRIETVSGFRRETFRSGDLFPLGVGQIGKFPEDAKFHSAHLIQCKGDTCPHLLIGPAVYPGVPETDIEIELVVHIPDRAQQDRKNELRDHR